MTLHRRTFLQSGAALAGAALGVPALAAGWPSRPLRIIIPFAPGGTSDTIARLIGKPLGDLLAQPIVIENKTGANGIIGAQSTAQATDEHTVLLTDMSSLAISPLVTKDLPYKQSDIKGVTMLAYSPHLLVAHPALAASNMRELVALSKTKPVNVSSAGSGSANHLGVVDIALSSGLRWQHVPFRGGAAALADTAAGNTQLCLNGMLATLPLVQGGRLKVIGVSKRTRTALLPNAPTIAEQGVKDFESGTYQGVVVPASMPKANAEKLAAALIQVIRAPEIRARLTEAGAEVMTSTPQETSDFLARENKRWANVIQRAGAQLEGNA
ncbi:tripartite tricarboxylate transporter substrate binding protein [Ramlibacter monticola]|uniref:Tripartite tricarboxylate transporter substrate binding protein n=1 Tax=Ramlibacter monticola TaxID=1926872 RepID=A0A936ZAG9_9BURK|nr:tripartite tricarboxylate transporter substrate binding protein [Ramlibacter monticola]MBL0395272.1 tripartite tricarboxylate transporter substrate binding protein [Ramlibacter monticola]